MLYQTAGPSNGLEYWGILVEYAHGRNRVGENHSMLLRQSDTRHRTVGRLDTPLLNFLDLNNCLALVGAAVQTGVMWQFEFVTLRADRHAGWCHPQFLSPSLVTPGSRMFMFRIWHGSSSKQSVSVKLPCSPSQPISVSYLGSPESRSPAAPQDTDRAPRLNLSRNAHTAPHSLPDRSAASALPR